MSVLKNKLKEKFVTVPQKIIMDNRLSFGAKVLYCYLVSKPNDWVIRNSEIMEALNISKDTIAKYFKELVVNGWIDRKRQVDSQNQFTGLYDYVIYETPKVSEIGKMPKSEDFRNRKNAEEITNTISSSNIDSINNKNNIKDNNNINNNINNKKEIIIDNSINDKIKKEGNYYTVKTFINDKQVYEAFKEKLEGREDIEKKTEKTEKGIDIPKAENNAKNEPKQKPNEEIGKDTKPKKKFVKPTIEQIKEYAKEANLVNLDPNAFFDHFESNGWKVSGISPMKDWKAAMRTWNRRTLQFNKQDNNKGRNKFYEMYQQMEEKGEE